MAAVLDRILAATRARVAESQRKADVRELERRAEQHVPRGFRRALLETHAVAKGATKMAQPEKGSVARDEAKWAPHCGQVRVIAELKKASPSKGLIRAEFDPQQLARELADAGAAALSVLTDEEFFQGSLTNLRKASAEVSIPCLRKDFIVDEFQLLEARANSADAVLLIVAALSPRQLKDLYAAARARGLDVLCEVHDSEELKRAIDVGCDLVGVNTRDLKTFEVKLQTAFELAEKFPTGVVRVAESGIHSADDVAHLLAAGYDAFLVGESLMRAARPGEALRELLGVPSGDARVASGG